MNTDAVVIDKETAVLSGTGFSGIFRNSIKQSEKPITLIPFCNLPNITYQNNELHIGPTGQTPYSTAERELRKTSEEYDNQTPAARPSGISFVNLWSQGSYEFGKGGSNDEIKHTESNSGNDSGNSNNSILVTKNNNTKNDPTKKKVRHEGYANTSDSETGNDVCENVVFTIDTQPTFPWSDSEADVIRSSTSDDSNETSLP